MPSAEARRTGAEGRASLWKGKRICQKSAAARTGKGDWNRFPNAAVISAGDLLTPGTGLRLVLNMCDVSVALRGHVRYTTGNRAMGVEFQEIRQGDRPLLDYVLNRLKKPHIEDFADLEVITEHLFSGGEPGTA